MQSMSSSTIIVRLNDAFHPFQESLVVMNEVNTALLKMFAGNADSGGTQARAGEGEAPGVGRLSLGSPQALGALDEEMESGSEVSMT